MDVSTGDSSNIGLLAENKLELAHQLIDKLKPYASIDGGRKIERRICQEVNFLQKKLIANELTINHILGSNLMHFNYLIAVLQRTEHVQHIDYAVKLDGQSKSLVRIDIVCDAGATWIKAIARNSRAISNSFNGEARFGAKSIFDHAGSYIRAANDNPRNFRPPKVVFDFSSGICATIVTELNRMGIRVRINGRSDECVEDAQEIRRLNLDITTMLAYVSALTNGSNRWIYTDAFLTQQAASERVASVKAFLDSTFDGKELIACETAINSFRDIISILGGQKEKTRAESLIKRLRVMPDLTPDQEQVTNDAVKLKVSAQIKMRTLKVFLFGIHHKAITVSSNEKFLRSAKMQGLDVPCILHEARALTENKEDTAKPFS